MPLDFIKRYSCRVIVCSPTTSLASEASFFLCSLDMAPFSFFFFPWWQLVNPFNDLPPLEPYFLCAHQVSRGTTFSANLLLFSKLSHLPHTWLDQYDFLSVFWGTYWKSGWVWEDRLWSSWDVWKSKFCCFSCPFLICMPHEKMGLTLCRFFFCSGMHLFVLDGVFWDGIGRGWDE